jgi:hypothetical protein
VQSESSDDCQTLAPVQSAVTPPECVASRKTEEVAGGGIVDAQIVIVEMTRASGIGADLLAFQDKCHVVWKVNISTLGFEM